MFKNYCNVRVIANFKKIKLYENVFLNKYCLCLQTTQQLKTIRQRILNMILSM